jgi:hypothetical protein
MSVIIAARAVDSEPVLALIDERGECSFGDAMKVLTDVGVTPSDARDTLWRLLSVGKLEFTAERLLRLP